MCFIPCAGIRGDNLLKATASAKESSWYQGKTLYDAMDCLRVPVRPLELPLRIAVDTVISSTLPGSSSAVTISGRINQGFLQNDETVVIQPSAAESRIKSIRLESDETPLAWAVAGDYVRISLSGVEDSQIGRRSVICPIHSRIPITHSFEARIVVFDVLIPLVNGSSLVFYRHSINSSVSVELIALIDKVSGEVVKKRPRVLISGQSAYVNITFVEQPECMETFKDSKEFGRFLLRRQGQTVAVGIVTTLFP